MSDDQLESAVTEIAGLQSQVKALELAMAAEADRREAGRREADTGADAWLAKLTGERRELLRGGIRLARRLETDYRATLDLLTQGRIRVDQARVIVDALDVSLDDATVEQRVQAEELLLAKATGEGSRSGRPVSLPQLRRSARRAFDTIDGELASRHLRRTVRANTHRGATNTWLTVHDNGDGTFSGRFVLPELHGKLLRAVLENLSAPRRHTVDKAGREISDAVAGGANGGLGWADRLGLAFCELLEHLPLDKLPKSAITMLVKLDVTTLTSQLERAGVGETATGTDIDAGDVRRLACEAGFVPAVLSGGSVPLDLGRTRRLHTDKQRQALALMYDGCAIAGCDREYGWTEIHHPDAWAAGGRTDLDNALPLCWHHHRAAHDERYVLERHSETEWVLRWRPKRC